MSSPPSAAEVADRLVALKCCVVWAMIAPPREVLGPMRARWSEKERDAFEEQAEEKRYAFWTPIDDTPVGDALTPHERELAESSMSSMTAEQQIEASWWTEAIAVLAWALGLEPALPPWDRLADPDVVQRVPNPPQLAAFREKATLRSADALERARAAAELWHWRSRTRELHEGGFEMPEDLKREGVKSLDDIVKVTAAHAAVEGAFDAPIAYDFPVRGKPYKDVDDAIWSELRSIAVERHRALNWLCGRAPGNRWDETSTET